MKPHWPTEANLNFPCQHLSSSGVRCNPWCSSVCLPLVIILSHFKGLVVESVNVPCSDIQFMKFIFMCLVFAYCFHEIVSLSYIPDDSTFAFCGFGSTSSIMCVSREWECLNGLLPRTKKSQIAQWYWSWLCKELTLHRRNTEGPRQEQEITTKAQETWNLNWGGQQVCKREQKSVLEKCRSRNGTVPIFRKMVSRTLRKI